MFNPWAYPATSQDRDALALVFFTSLKRTRESEICRTRGCNALQHHRSDELYMVVTRSVVCHEKQSSPALSSIMAAYIHTHPTNLSCTSHGYLAIAAYTMDRICRRIGLVLVLTEVLMIALKTEPLRIYESNRSSYLAILAELDVVVGLP